MHRFFRLIVAFGLIASLACGCSKPDKPMPLTKENIAQYIQKVEAVVKGTTPIEIEGIKGNPDKQKEMYYRSVVEPMEKMGYSYDKTIGAIAQQVLAKSLRTSDSAMTIMISNTLAFAKNTRDSAYTYGFISKETKELLDQVSLIFPR